MEIPPQKGTGAGETPFLQLNTIATTLDENDRSRPMAEVA